MGLWSDAFLLLFARCHRTFSRKRKKAKTTNFQIGSLCNSIVPQIWHLVASQVHFQTKTDGLSFVTLSTHPSLSQPSNVFILCDPSRRRPFFCCVCLNIKLLVKFVTKVMPPWPNFATPMSQATFSTNAPSQFVFLLENVTYRRITLGSTQWRVQDAFLRI